GSDVDSTAVGRAGVQQHIAEPAGGRTGVHTAQAAGVDAECVQSADQLGGGAGGELDAIGDVDDGQARTCGHGGGGSGDAEVVHAGPPLLDDAAEIGRASCREEGYRLAVSGSYVMTDR